MSKMFRAIFVKNLRTKFPELKQDFLNQFFEKEWVVYAKRPILKSETIVEYLVSNQICFSHTKSRYFCV